MNKTSKKHWHVDALIIWLGVLPLAVVLVMTTIGLSRHFAEQRRHIEPELTITANNNYEETLRVVGDIDYKPFSYMSGNSEARGYDIELVTELANRIGRNLELKLMNWNDAVSMIQENKADLILGCDWQDATVIDCKFTIPTYEEPFVVFQKKPFKLKKSQKMKTMRLLTKCLWMRWKVMI